MADRPTLDDRPIDHDDRQVVTVPRWAMLECGGDARDAMVLAQITWWLQPRQSDGAPRTSHLVERDGHQWMYLTDAELAEDLGMSRAQVQRARASLAKRGLVESRSAKVDGEKATLVRPVVAGSREIEQYEVATLNQTLDPRATSRDSQSREVARSRARAIPSCQETEGETEPPHGVAVATPDVEALCVHLADRVEAFHPTRARPPITDRWRKDMRLLVERGPLRDEHATAMSPARVRASIDAVFDQLAEPTGRDGFCWAAQIRSPHALRDHWAQLALAFHRLQEASMGKTARRIRRRGPHAEALFLEALGLDSSTDLGGTAPPELPLGGTG